MADYYYDTEGGKRLKQLKQARPELFQAFSDFNSKVFQPGALGLKEKELIALACAHITQCPYCIDGHTRRAREAGAKEEEIAEAIFVAVALRAGGGLAHASVAMRSAA